MELLKRGSTVECGGIDGIWLDFKDDTWIFYIKDDVWTKEEIKCVYHRDINVWFVQKGAVDLFLLNIYDTLETSDVPFCLADADDELLSSLKNANKYYYGIVCLDKNNVVMASRKIEFAEDNSVLLKERLRARLDEGLSSAAFDAAYDDLSNAFEPYELEELALFSQTD